MFEKLKKVMLERQERDSVKSMMTYRPKKNNEETITEEVIMKRSKLLLVGDWGRVYPPVNENGTWNIQNLLFGGTKNLIKLIMIGTIVAIILMGYKELFNYISILEEACPPAIKYIS